MSDEETARRIAGQFGLTVRSVQRIRNGVCQITATSGAKYSLKRLYAKKEQLLWMDRSLLAVRKNGFSGISWRHPQSVAGRVRYVPQGNAKYILTPWIAGRHPRADSCEDMTRCARALATFHLAGRQMNLPSDGANDDLGVWPDRLAYKMKFLRYFIAEANKESRNSATQKMLRDAGTFLLARAEKATDELRNSAYLSLCATAAKQRTLCHGDSGANNFILTKRGPYLIDFETLKIDLPIFDVFRLIRLAGKKNGWDAPIALAALSAYSAVTTVSPEELQLLYVWLQFPKKVCRLLQRRQTHPESDKELALQLQHAVAESNKIDAFVHNLQKKCKAVI